MKKILSFFLVLCMLLAAVPALALPAFAEGDDEATVLAEYNFVEEFAPGLTYTISEVYKNQPIGGQPFATDEEYMEWLLSDGVFAVNQGNSNWKVGEFDVNTGKLDLFARIAFTADDLVSQVTGQEDEHDMSWVVTESRYKTLVEQYVTTGGGNIWSGNAIWHLHAGSVYKQENGLATTQNALAYGRITNSGDGSFKSAVQYTVTEAGVYGVKLNSFSDSLNGHAIAIFVNDKLVWPAGAKASTHNTWTKTNASTSVDMLNGLLAPLTMKVEVGDTISFVTGSTGDAMVWDPTLLRLDGVPVYLSLADPNGPNSNTMKVKPGQTVKLPKYEGTNIFFGWDSNGDGAADFGDEAEITIGDESVTLTAVILEPSKFYDERPYWDTDTESVVFPGNWTLGVWEKETGLFLPVANHSTPFISHAASVWGASGGGMYDTERPGVIVSTGTGDTEGGWTDMEEGGFITSLQYTATYNGDVAIDFDQLTIKRELNPTEDSAAAPILAGFAIYVDGEKVWPEGDKEYYWFSSVDVLGEEAGIFSGRNHQVDFYAEMKKAGTWPFPVNVEGVEMGQVVDIRAVCGTPYNWGFYIRPFVSYTALDETPVISSTSVDIAEDFTLNIYANVLGKTEGSEVNLEYWTAKPSAIALQNGGKPLELLAEENGLYKFAYEGLTAKQMADVIYVRPYTVNGETEIYGNVAEVSIQKYAQAAMGKSEKLDNLLIAMLNYGKSAQNLFNYKTDNFANAFLTDAQQRKTADMNAVVDSYAQSGDNNKIKFVSLLLGTDIGMKYVIDKIEGAETYELEYSKNADFTDSTKIPMVATKEDREMKASYNISLSEIQDVFYVRVIVDGEAGATLTYSVESYVVRVSPTADDGMYYALRALAYLGQALKAYQA